MAVTRCICRNVTFAELLKLSARTGADFEQLSERTGAGTNCGMCREYIRAALATGESSIPLMSNRELREWARRDGRGILKSET
jgi:bacterioferritin-associated ferredoxin